MGDKQDEGLLLEKKERDRIIKAHALSALPSIRTAVECACKAQLAKAKQHYELEKAFAKEEGFNAGVGHERKYGQERLGRPELMEKLDEFEKLVESHYNSWFSCPSWKVDKARNELLALIPDIEEAKREERERIRDLLPENPWENNNRGCNPDKRVAINKILDKIRQILRGE